MGLDMFALKTLDKVHLVGSLNDLQQIGINIIEFARWRKHPNLHGWMEKLYRNKGGKGVFNCDYVVLNQTDLDRLEHDVQHNRLPETTGFFFGVSHPDHKAIDEAFIADARAAMEQNFTVLYSSWW